MVRFLLLKSPQESISTVRLSSFNFPNLKKYRKSNQFLLESSLSPKRNNVRSSSQATLKTINHVEIETTLNDKGLSFGEEESDDLPYVQTLREFPKKELFEKVVMVRFDSSILLSESESESESASLFTIKYLHEAKAKVILVSDWSSKNGNSETVADLLTHRLQYKVVPVRGISRDGKSKMEGFEKGDILLLDNLSEFKEEVANCPEFAEALSSKVDIFLNEAFSQSHKILASIVGVTRFCYASLAGFHFDESINRLRNVAETGTKPYVAIIGGGKILDKGNALRFLASICDGLVFVGAMAFQIMHVLGLPVPSNLIDHGTLIEALEIVRFAESRNVKLVYPKDFWCRNDRLMTELEVFPSHGIIEGWIPVDIGPESLNEIEFMLTKSKKILWIGPVKFHKSSNTSKLAQTLDQLRQSNCDVTVVGKNSCEALIKNSSLISDVNMIFNASVVWEFLKGRKLPGIDALDKAYPFDIDWNDVFLDPYKPLVVDIGSGNGLFLLGMSEKRKEINYLGLEINRKLVRCCLDSVQRLRTRNGYFIATNATTSFRSIVSSYPGKLVLVSIQCPNPDFNNPENRWRILQRTLVEAIVELLTPNGKVFLQSDVEAVTLRMKREFLKYVNGNLVVETEKNTVTSEGWLSENPFGVRSDWEQHVLDRGFPMYRLMLSKSDSVKL